MIRVYLDWNVVSNLKLPRNNHIVDFINKNKQHLLFLYSPAHFNDLMKSDKDHPNFEKDLEMLEWLCGKHHIRWENDQIAPLFGTPSNYFDQIRNSPELKIDSFDIEKLFETIEEAANDNPNLGHLIEIWKKVLQTKTLDFGFNEDALKVFNLFFPDLSPNASIWELTKAFGISNRALFQNKHIWLELRKQIESSGGRLESNSGNWSKEDVITKVDDFICKISPVDISFFEYINLSFKDRDKPANIYELYQIAYLTLDLLGYKSDSLPKPTDGLHNITTDIDHSFLAQTCDIFVLEDKKMKAKTEALFHYFNISTDIINLKDFIDSCSELFFENEISTSQSIINEFFKKNGVQLTQLVSNDKEPFAYKVQKRFVNFFDFVHFEYNKESSLMCFTFQKDEFKYGRFLYFTEREYLVNELEKFFQHFDESDQYKELRLNFIKKSEFNPIVFDQSSIHSILWKDGKYSYPLLTMFLPIDHETEKSV